MIIIPIKWLNWEYTQHFQTNPHGAPGPVLVHFGTQKALLLGQQHLRLRQEVTRRHLALQQPRARVGAP